MLRAAVRQGDGTQPHHIPKRRLGIGVCTNQPSRSFCFNHRRGAGRRLSKLGIDAVRRLHFCIGNGVDRNRSLHGGLCRGVIHVDQIPRLR